MLSFFGAKLRERACASVFTAHSSTPNIPVELSIILLTALPPPPPTPITFIRQGEPDPSAMEEIENPTFFILAKNDNEKYLEQIVETLEDLWWHS
jgi:hypothetical protein